MTRQSRPRKGPSLRRLRGWLRFRQSWTRYSLRRLERKLLRETRRYSLMLAQQDNQLLLLKELQERHLLMAEHQQEQLEIRQFRLQELEPPPMVTPEALDQELLQG